MISGRFFVLMGAALLSGCAANRFVVPPASVAVADSAKDNASPPVNSEVGKITPDARRSQARGATIGVGKAHGRETDSDRLFSQVSEQQFAVGIRRGDAIARFFELRVWGAFESTFRRTE